MRKTKSLFKFQISTKNFEETCPQCNKHAGFIVHRPLFRENSKDWGVVCNFCGWEEAKDKNIYSRYL